MKRVVIIAVLFFLSCSMGMSGEINIFDRISPFHSFAQKENSAPNTDATQSAEIIKIGDIAITIPIPAGFTDGAAPRNKIENTSLGAIKLYFQYINGSGSGEKTIATSISVFSMPTYDSHLLSSDDFSNIKAASKLSVKYQKEALSKAILDYSGHDGIINEIGDYAEGGDFLASYMYSEANHRQYLLRQHSTNTMMLIKGKIIILTYVITTEIVDRALANDAKKKILAWRDVIIAANGK